MVGSWLRRWLDRKLGGRRRHGCVRPRGAGVRLALEGLEGRELPANVLLLPDIVGGAGPAALQAALVAAGNTVTMGPLEYTWNGSNPSLTGFDAVVQLDGATYSPGQQFSVTTQQALETFVQNGGIFVGGQWLGYEQSQGTQVNMPDLVLQTWGTNNHSSTTPTYTTVGGQAGHPVLTGIPSPFTFSADGGAASAMIAFGTQPSTVLMTDSSGTGGPGVIARTFGLGHVVSLSVSPDYQSVQNTLLDTNIQKLYVNAVQWATVSLSQSTVSVVPGSIQAGTSSTVTLQSKDSSGNNLTIGGLIVSFALGGGSGSGTFSAVADNGNGTYTATFTGTTAGSNTITATVGGQAVTSAAPTITVTAGTPTSIATVAGTPQSTAVATSFSTGLQAIVRDAYNNPVGAGVTVTFTVNAVSGAGASFSGSTTASVSTNAAGVATAPTLTANNVIGSYTVTASTSGVATGATYNLSNVAGAPASITTTAGSGQTATVNANFGTALQATVKDSFGNLVSGATVTFTAPTSPGATFAGSVTATASTNASGVATSPTVTADLVAGSYTATASVTGVATPASYSLTNTAGAATNILASAGSGQSTTVNTNFGTALQAKVTDTYGNPISGMVVTFTAPGSGASGSFSGSATVTASTNASGFATAPTFTANSVSGSYSVTATFSGGPTASYSLQNNPGTPANIAVSAGSGQSTTVNTNFSTALQATVTDAFGNPVAAGYSVTFTAPSSGASGTFSGSATATVSTNSSGVATAPTLAANTSAGSYSVSAAVSGASSPAQFSLTNSPGTAVSLTVTAGSGQSATVAANFATSLQATVTDGFGNPVSGVSVTFTPPSSGASGTFAASSTVTTNGSGVATAPTFTANTVAGSYNVQASSAGLSSVNYGMTNTPGAAALISATAGASQQATVGSAFGTAMQATVTDQYGNAVTNATVSVTFTAPSSGASGTFTGGALTATATTNSSGVATAPTFTANSTTGGPYTVTATFSGASNSASFSLTNNAGAAATITVTAGSNQSAYLGTAFTTPMQATVKDQNGNLVANAVVVFSAPTSGASGTFSVGSSVSVLTNSSGVATAPTFTANLYSGSYNVTASSGSATPASFRLTNKSAAVRLVAIAPATVIAGRPFLVTVKAIDASGNLTPYTGTVAFSGTAGPVGLPASYTFQPSDGGKHVFTVRIRAVGNQRIYIQDTQKSSLFAVITARGFYSYRLS